MLAWHQYLIEWRKVLRHQIQWMESGRMRVLLNREDVTANTLETEQENLAEVEQILAEAGIALGD